MSFLDSRAGIAVVCAFILAFLVNPAYAQSDGPEITDIIVIPGNVSADGSFIVKVETNGQFEPVRLPYWASAIIHGPISDSADQFTGQIPKVGDDYVCVFSNDPDLSTCGPTPFGVPTEELGTVIDCQTNPQGYGCFAIEMKDAYTEFLELIDEADILYLEIYTDILGKFGYLAEEKSNDTAQISIGGIRLEPLITIEEENVTIQVGTGGKFADVKYAVYYKNLTVFQDYKDMERQPSMFYMAHFELIPGDFYVAFEALKSDGSDYGGTVYNLTIPYSAAYPDYCDGVIPLPSGVLSVERVHWKPIIDADKHTETNFRMTNDGNDTLYNLSMEIPDAHSDYIEIDLQKTTLTGGSSGHFTISLDNIDRNTNFTFSADLYGSTELGANETTKLAVIPMTIEISVRDSCNVAPATKAEIELEDYVWSETLLTGEPHERVIWIKNNGDEDLEDFDSETSGLSNKVGVDLPDKIEPGKTEDMTITAQATDPKSYYGTLTIMTSGGNVDFLVGLTFVENPANKIDAVEREAQDVLDDYGDDVVPEAIVYVIGDVEDKIEEARTYLESEDYDEAVESYKEARYKVDAIGYVSDYYVPGTPPPGEGVDIFTIIIIIVVIGGAAFGIWYYMTKIKKKGGGFGSESGIENEDDLDI